MVARQEEGRLLLLLLLLLVVTSQHQLGRLQLCQLGRIQPGIQRQELGWQQKRAAAAGSLQQLVQRTPAGHHQLSLVLHLEQLYGRR
jgi:hypothetical protein